MFYKTLAAAAMSLALATGAAMAQSETGESDSVQNPDAGQAGETPAVTGSVQGGDTVNRMPFFETNADMIGSFFADDTMATLRTEEEINTSFAALTPEQQQALRDDCTNVTGDTSNTYGQSVVDLCTTVGAMAE